MGDYAIVKCQRCKAEIADEYVEDLAKKLITFVPECNECYEKDLCSNCIEGCDAGYSDAYDEGYNEGHSKGYDEGHRKKYCDGQNENKKDIPPTLRLDKDD